MVISTCVSESGKRGNIPHLRHQAFLEAALDEREVGEEVEEEWYCYTGPKEWPAERGMMHL